MSEKTKYFETKRLILRKKELSDAKQMFDNYCSKDKVTEFMSWSSHKSIDDTIDFLNNVVLPAYENNSAYDWAVVLKETNEVIGSIAGCKYDLEKKSAELGWVLDDRYWGQGLMPEAATVIRDYLFSEGFVRVWAEHNVKNSKSGRVMQKIGMQHEGTLRKSAFNNKGELVDMEIYSIIKND